MSSQSTQDAIGYLVKQLQQTIRAHLDRALAAHGVTMATYPPLAILDDEAGLSNAELARRCFVTPQTMNRIVRDLEDTGLVQRHPDPDHGRIQRTRLTQEGALLVDQCHDEVGTVHDQMLANLTTADTHILHELLIRCLDGLASASPDTPV